MPSLIRFPDTTIDVDALDETLPLARLYCQEVAEDRPRRDALYAILTRSINARPPISGLPTFLVEPARNIDQ